MPINYDFIVMCRFVDAFDQQKKNYFIINAAAFRRDRFLLFNVEAF